MSSAVIQPAQLAGTVQVPPSKSMAHRAMIAAALAGDGQLENLGDSQDIRATRSCLDALRAAGEGLPSLDCGESGSTLRFLIPVALALRGGGHFTGHGRLMERPQDPYFRIFDQKGVHYQQKDGVLTVEGRLSPGQYQLPGDVSSQFITGLLFALPLLDGASEIVLTSPLESEGYVDMTLEVLERFGVQVEREGYSRFSIPAGQRYRPCGMTIPGDWSQGAIWYAANFLDHRVDIWGLDEKSSQGDRIVASYYWKLARPGDVELDVSQCPDLAPALGAMAALRHGTATLTGAGRLRIKESDRLAAIVSVVNGLGGAAEEGADTLAIHGREHLSGGCTIDSRNDHRIAMMTAILATRCQAPVTLIDIQCVEKSYPDFWEHYCKLGGKLNVI